ncbi:MAG: hypothetical protein U9R43_03290 [Thermodesulfobacteriota bacterium]|nr:hypothetical protein [Thermodesulfobacteriota bacterium]
MIERFNVDVHAYVLMSNHLLLKANDANLSRAMQWFGTSYTRKIKICPPWRLCFRRIRVVNSISVKTIKKEIGK